MHMPTKNIYISERIAKEIKEKGIKPSELFAEAVDRYSVADKRIDVCTDVPVNKIDWTRVKENNFDSCLYLVRSDGLTDYERLSKRTFMKPELLADYYKSILAAEKTAEGRLLIELLKRKVSLLEYIKNGVKFVYLPSTFISDFEKHL